jgi:hypothetical protein
MSPPTHPYLESCSDQSNLIKDLSLELMANVMAVDTITTTSMSMVADQW